VKQFAFKIKTLSPLAIRADHSPTGVHSIPYIPGSTLLGSLAATHRLLYPNKQEEFADFFLRGKIQYPNLYPASFKPKRESDDVRGEGSLPVYPIPRTAQTCKRFGGFKRLKDEPKGDDEARHGVRDSLFDWAIFTLLQQNIASTSEESVEKTIFILEQHKTCPVCDQPLDSYIGYYRRYSNSELATAHAETRLLTRTGINREYGIVQENILYNYLVFEENTNFFGLIQANDDIADQFFRFLLPEESEQSDLFYSSILRLGTSKTRGLGRVDFTVQPLPDTENNFTTFKRRVQIFNDSLRMQAKQSGLTLPHPCYIALTLHAPVILHDEWLRQEGCISAQRLAKLTGLDRVSDDLFTLLYYSTSIRRLMGWQALWGLPRAYDYALEAGSVFFYAVNQPIDDTWLSPLFELEQHGIGQRRAEGFGRIAIADPFHQEVTLR
jgi:CRISPR-associated protein Csx10